MENYERNFMSVVDMGGKETIQIRILLKAKILKFILNKKKVNIRISWVCFKAILFSSTKLENNIRILT